MQKYGHTRHTHTPLIVYYSTHATLFLSHTHAKHTHRHTHTYTQPLGIRGAVRDSPFLPVAMLTVRVRPGTRVQTDSEDRCPVDDVITDVLWEGPMTSRGKGGRREGRGKEVGGEEGSK